jgi:hypothetical protein
MNLPSKLLAAAVLAISAAAFAAPGNAVPIAAPSSLQNAAAPSIEAVQWRRGWRGRGGVAGDQASWPVRSWAAPSPQRSPVRETPARSGST